MLPSRGWGPGEAVLLGFIGFLAMQISTATIVGALLAAFDVPRVVLDSNAFNFGFYAMVSLAAAAPIWFFLRQRKLDLSVLGFDKPKLQNIWLALPAIVAYFAIAGLVYSLVALVAPGVDLDQAQELGFVATQQLSQLILIFISLVVIPPVVEEAVFRGFIFRGLRARLAFWQSTLISSIGFGLAHWQLNIGLDTAVLGVVSCWLYERTGSLWPSISLHVLKNLLAFALKFVFSV